MTNLSISLSLLDILWLMVGLCIGLIGAKVVNILIRKGEEK